MAKHQVDLIFQGYDKVTGSIDRISAKMTKMNQDVYNLSAEITRQTMAGENHLATFRKMRTEYMAVAKAALLVGVALRGAEGITGGAIKWRDEGFAAGFTEFISKIPIIGGILNNLGGNIAELFVNANKEITKSNALLREQAVTAKFVLGLLKSKESITEEIGRFKTPVSEKPEYDINLAYSKKITELDDLKRQATRMINRGDINAGRALFAEVRREKELTDEWKILSITDARAAATDKLTKKTIELTWAQKEFKSLFDNTKDNPSPAELRNMMHGEIGKSVTPTNYIDFLKLQEKDAANYTKKALQEMYDAVAKPDKWERLLRGLREKLLPDSEMSRMELLVGQVRTIEDESKQKTFGPKPSLAANEMGLMTGWISPNSTINYDAQIAKNTSETPALLRQIKTAIDQLNKKQTTDYHDTLTPVDLD